MSTISIKSFTITSFLFLLLVLSKGTYAEQVAGNSSLPDQSSENQIPPPPPGPYISTGLLEAVEEKPTAPASPSPSVNLPASSDTAGSVVSAPVVVKPAMAKSAPTATAPPAPRFESNAVPMSTFSPDRPWPNNMRPMDVPAQAYQQAVPSMVQKPSFNNAPPAYNPPAYSQGYNRNARPYMNVPATQWAPPMNARPQSANGYMPSMPTSQYGYQMPGGFVPQNNTPYGYQMNRMPYPPTSYQQGYPN